MAEIKDPWTEGMDIELSGKRYLHISADELQKIYRKIKIYEGYQLFERVRQIHDNLGDLLKNSSTEPIPDLSEERYIEIYDDFNDMINSHVMEEEVQAVAGVVAEVVK